MLTILKRRPVLWSASLFALLAVAITAWLIVRPANETLLQEGLRQLKLQNAEGAAKYVRELQDRGAIGEVAILKGQIALMTGNAQEAVRQSFIAAEHLPAAFDLIHALRVEALYRAGRLADAERYASRWSARSNTNADAFRWLAAIFYDLGAMDQALSHLDRLTKLQPADANAIYLTGVIYHDFERFPEAIETLQRLLKLPQVSEAIRLDATLRLGDSLIQQHEYYAALDVLKPLTQSGKALARCALVSDALGMKPLANKFMRRAAEVAPDEPEVWEVSATRFMNRRQFEYAAGWLEKLITQDPANFDALRDLSSCWQALGKAEKAAEYLKRFEDTQAKVLRLAELQTEAIQFPFDPQRREMIARLHEELGQHEQAVMWTKAAEACRQFAESMSAVPGTTVPAVQRPAAADSF
jgi:tetratricopeptide (TPR) repeat protein